MTDSTQPLSRSACVTGQHVGDREGAGDGAEDGPNVTGLLVGAADGDTDVDSQVNPSWTHWPSAQTGPVLGFRRPSAAVDQPGMLGWTSGR